MWEDDGTEHVIYFCDAHIHELWFRKIWNHVDLTQVAGAPAILNNEFFFRPCGYLWKADRTEHVVYVSDDDHHVHELWYQL